MRSTTLVLFESGRFAFRAFALGLGDSEGNISVDPRPSVEREDAAKARLLQEITRSLLHFQWRSGMGKPSLVCVTGPGAQLAGLVEAVALKLKIPVKVSDFTEAIEIADELVAKTVSEHTSTLIDLIGAATIRLRPDHPMINLLPPRAYERMSYRQRRPWLVAAALLATFTLVPPLVHFRKVRDEAQIKSAAIERELAPFRARDLRNRENLQRLADLKQRILMLENIRERRASWLRWLSGLQDRLGEVQDVWLEKLQVAPRAADAPLKLMISGRMLDRAHPLSKVSPETFVRVKTLLSQLTDTPFVTAVEAERFDNQQPGILKFDFVLVGDVKRPL
jgi:type IV pilus assembly protein PilM